MNDLDLKTNPQRPEKLVIGEIEQGVGHVHWRVSNRARVWRPPTDVYVTETAVKVRVEIAGMSTSEFTIALNDQHLSIRGERTEPSEKRAYHQMEVNFGEFATEVEIHWEIDAEAVEAEYNDGFLQITLPLAKPHKVEVGK